MSDFLINAAFGIALLLVAAVLLWRHVSFWRTIDTKKLDQQDANYFRAQYRRRMQTSTMIGVVGMVIIAANWLDSPVMQLLYLIGLVLLVCWILLMALSDLLSTRGHLQQMGKSHLIRQTELQAEIDRLRREQRTGEENGKSNRKDNNDKKND